MTVEDTACGIECAFVKSGFCESDRGCPFYCESIWQNQDGSQVKVVKDCSPKRSTFEVNNLHLRMKVLQSHQEDLRNRFDTLQSQLSLLIELSKEYINQQEAERQNCMISNQQYKKLE